MFTTWPLKAKYRSKNYKEVEQVLHGGKIITKVVQMGSFPSRPSTGVKKHQGKTLAPRRRAYGPWYKA